MTDAPAESQYIHWGDDIDAAAHEQMRNACRLPVTVGAALMPDAHVGYGLPIGGVLATDNAVIPYAVGVDIACRVMVTIFDRPPEDLQQDQRAFWNAIEKSTRFGVGAAYQGAERAHHPVLDEDWTLTPVTKERKDVAWSQLGASGSGNHFVEFGEIEITANDQGIAPGRFLAVVSHSGSRGAGAAVANYYSKAAAALHPELPRELRELAWLPLTGPHSDLGQEYWAAMELMGRYASANHHVIHQKLVQRVGAPVIAQVENHHNFAWKETHAGRDVIVHRKGATPAGAGALGYIPGSMAAPGFLVVGKGDPRSLDSASHGAGRRMSRTQAKKSERWDRVKEQLRAQGVTLMSAGLDEAPNAYKDIRQVMAAQAELVQPIATFTPRLVKMAPAGERPED